MVKLTLMSGHTSFVDDFKLHQAINLIWKDYEHNAKTELLRELYLLTHDVLCAVANGKVENV